MLLKVNNPNAAARTLASAALSVFCALCTVSRPASGASLSDLRMSRAQAPDAAGEAAYDFAAELVKRHTPRHSGTKEGRAAAAWIFSKASIPGWTCFLDSFSDATPDGERWFCNVFAALPCETGAQDKKWVVFISHFDTTPNGGAGFQGANDSASTTGLLLALQRELLRKKPRNVNVLFLWTDGEEARYHYAENDGFHGAKHALAVFRTLKLDVEAVVGLDMLGDRDLRIEIPANGTGRLKKIALDAAPDIVSLSRGRVHDDFAIFFEAGYPAVNLIDFQFGPGNSWWHTPEDNLGKISPASLSRAAHLALSILSKLDGNM